MAFGRPGHRFLHSSRALSFSASVFVLLVLAWINRATPMYGDAAGYWSLGHSFSSESGYVDRLRGYAVPFFISVIQQTAQLCGVNDVVLFRIVMAIVGAALFAVALPRLLTWLVNGRESAFASMLFCAAGIGYWHEHFLYSLSDFPALLLLTIGLLCLRREPARPWPAVRACTSGACLGLAANARPVFAIALAAAVIFVGWDSARPGAWRRAAAPAMAFALGMALALVPQSVINARTLQTSNPFGHGQLNPRLPNLYQQQLAWGIAIQKYETNIGAGFPIAVMFMDPQGQALLGQDWSQDPRVTIARSRMSLRSYVRLVVANPLFFASAYARHLFNGLDVAYPTPYVAHLAPRNALRALINYGVLVLAAVHGAILLRSSGVRADGRRLAIGGILMLPVIFAIPTAVEPRFMLPLWVLAYGFVVFRLIGTQGARALVRPWPVAVVMGAAIVACFAVASATYSHIFGAPADFNLWCVWC